MVRRGSGWRQPHERSERETGATDSVTVREVPRRGGMLSRRSVAQRNGWRREHGGLSAPAPLGPHADACRSPCSPRGGQSSPRVSASRSARGESMLRRDALVGPSLKGLTPPRSPCRSPSIPPPPAPPTWRRTRPCSTPPPRASRGGRWRWSEPTISLGPAFEPTGRPTCARAAALRRAVRIGGASRRFRMGLLPKGAGVRTDRPARPAARAAALRRGGRSSTTGSGPTPSRVPRSHPLAKSPERSYRAVHGANSSPPSPPRASRRGCGGRGEVPETTRRSASCRTDPRDVVVKSDDRRGANGRSSAARSGGGGGRCCSTARCWRPPRPAAPGAARGWRELCGLDGSRRCGRSWRTRRSGSAGCWRRTRVPPRRNADGGEGAD